MTEKEKHLFWMVTEFTINRYLMSNAHGRWDGAEKAQRHAELCDAYVAYHFCCAQDDAMCDHSDEWDAVHDKTQELTSYMDREIGFPLDKRPDYGTLAPKFLERFIELAGKGIKL